MTPGHCGFHFSGSEWGLPDDAVTSGLWHTLGEGKGSTALWVPVAQPCRHPESPGELLKCFSDSHTGLEILI